MPWVITRRTVTLAGLVALLMLAGCADDTPRAETVDAFPDVGIDLTSTVDPTSGAIVFPYERLDLSEEERAVLGSASAILAAQCAQDRGVDWRAASVSTYSTLYDSSIYFGVWTTDQASRFAFAPPMTNADLVANGTVEAGTLDGAVGTPEQPDLSELRAALEHNATVSETDREIVAECGSSDEVNRLQGVSLFSGPWNSKLGEAMQSFDALPEVEEIYAELDGCLVDAGLTPDSDNPGFPRGADFNRIDEEQIRLALQVVECKSQIDFVERLADLMAQQQAPVLVEYADELLAERATADAVVAEARAVLAAAQADG